MSRELKGKSIGLSDTLVMLAEGRIQDDFWFQCCDNECIMVQFIDMVPLRRTDSTEKVLNSVLGRLNPSAMGHPSGAFQ